jgi:hypothetical protein
MLRPILTAFAVALLASVSPLSLESAVGATIDSETVFATGAAIGATGPDSVTVGNGSVWVAYTNGASSTGGSGSSTVVQYSLSGQLQHQFSIAGSVDGLKIDPSTGLVWALQNQDGNSTISFINPATSTVSPAISPAVASASRGYDDVAFLNKQVFLSYTNPTGPGDATIQKLAGGANPANPFLVSTILSAGATGTNLVTGQTNQPTAQNDPDSLKATPKGDLVLTSGDDGQLIFVHNPGTASQSVSFLQLKDPATGADISGLDDAIIPGASKGEFFLADTGHNRVVEIAVSSIGPNDLFASAGSTNDFGLVDPTTGNVDPFITDVLAPHGVDFLATPEPTSIALLASGLGLLCLCRREPGKPAAPLG